MDTKEKIIQAINDSILDMETRIPQFRFDDVKKACACAKLAIFALKKHFPEEDTAQFEAQITKLVGIAKATAEQVPTQTRDEQLRAYGDSHWKRGGNYDRNRLLGVKNIQIFKDTQSRQPLTWLKKAPEPTAASALLLLATVAETTKLK